jgi:hypothetical protein
MTGIQAGVGRKSSIRFPELVPATRWCNVGPAVFPDNQ